MAPESVSKLPSGLVARKVSEEKKGETASSYEQPQETPSGGSNLPMILAVIALLLGAFSLYVSLSAPRGLSEQDRLELKAIAGDLRDIQNKEITLTSPLRTTVYIEKTFPIADILPDSFSVPITFSMPIDTTVTAQSNTGQLVPLHIKDTLNVHASVPVDVNKTYEGVKVSINKEIPIDTRFSATLKVSAVYGKELNDLIDRVEKLSESR